MRETERAVAEARDAVLGEMPTMWDADVGQAVPLAPERYARHLDALIAAVRADERARVAESGTPRHPSPTPAEWALWQSGERLSATAAWRERTGIRDLAIAVNAFKQEDADA